jgi:hypothetical protein
LLLPLLLLLLLLPVAVPTVIAPTPRCRVATTKTATPVATRYRRCYREQDSCCMDLAASTRLRLPPSPTIQRDKLGRSFKAMEDYTYIATKQSIASMIDLMHGSLERRKIQYLYAVRIRHGMVTYCEVLTRQREEIGRRWSHSPLVSVDHCCLRRLWRDAEEASSSSPSSSLSPVGCLPHHVM